MRVVAISRIALIGCNHKEIYRLVSLRIVRKTYKMF